MKGIVLAGGTGSRLGPLTRTINKHCLPVGLVPMIYHPISQLLYNNITEICIVSGLSHLGFMVEMLGSGKRFGCSFTYKVQEESGGIAEALSLCEGFAGNDSVAVILGDNIFGEPLSLSLPENFDAVLYLKAVLDPHRFGVAEVDHLKKLIDIEEKPENPKSNLAVTGAYVYSPYVWEVLKSIPRSARGELEISDANKMILKTKQVFTIELAGWWSDAGTQDSYIKVNRDIWTNLSLQISEIISNFIKY